MAPGEPMGFNFAAASIRASLCAYRSRSLLVLRSMRSLSLPSALMRSLKTVVACSSSDMSSNDDSLEVASKCKGGGWIVIEALLSGRKNPALGGKTGSFPGLGQPLGMIRRHLVVRVTVDEQYRRPNLADHVDGAYRLEIESGARPDEQAERVAEPRTGAARAQHVPCRRPKIREGRVENQGGDRRILGSGIDGRGRALRGSAGDPPFRP